MKYKLIIAFLIIISVVVYGELIVKKSNDGNTCRIELIYNAVYSGIVNMVDLQVTPQITCPNMRNYETEKVCKKRPMYNCCYIAKQE